jgi:hypothetical protein
MFDFPIRIPHLFVLLAAAAWILFLFFRKPEYLSQNAFILSFIEGLLSGVAWVVFLYWTSNDPLEGLLWSGLLTASLWTSVVYYCRYRYWQSIRSSA